MIDEQKEREWLQSRQKVYSVWEQENRRQADVQFVIRMVLFALLFIGIFAFGYFMGSQ